MYTQGKKSEQIYAQSCQLMPGGVNSPVRSFQSVGALPFIAERGKGAMLYDVDEREYLDCVCSWGPLILGHADSRVLERVQEKLWKGLTFGAPTEGELRLAQMITQAVPSIEMLRLVSSGTEGVMSAVRLARGYTGRNIILKFDGCYHGHSDSMLVKAGSGLATQGTADSGGLPSAIALGTVNLPYNSSSSVKELFEKFGDDIAGVIVEPVAGNMGVVPPVEGFLQTLRDVTKAHGSLLIFDEVITGFRVSYHGAQGLFGIEPDLTVLGKIIGGGMPLAAFGGRRELMECVAPLGNVYQAGTLSGNPAAVAAGIAALEVLQKKPQIYMELEEKGAELEEKMKACVKKYGADITINRCGSLLTPFFTNIKVKDFTDAKTADTGRYAAYFRFMLSKGIFLPPSQFEAMFLSAAHTMKDIQRIVQAFEDFLKTPECEAE